MSTISDVITEARQIVQDVKTPYRHSDDKVYAYLNSAINDTKRLRADLFLPSTAAAPISYTSDDGDLPFPIDLSYFTTIVDFIAARIGLEDDEFAVGGRAVLLQQMFIAKLTGKTA